MFSLICKHYVFIIVLGHEKKECSPESRPFHYVLRFDEVMTLKYRLAGRLSTPEMVGSCLADPLSAPVHHRAHCSCRTSFLQWGYPTAQPGTQRSVCHFLCRRRLRSQTHHYSHRGTQRATNGAVSSSRPVSMGKLSYIR